MSIAPPTLLNVFISCPEELSRERERLWSLEDKLTQRGYAVRFIREDSSSLDPKLWETRADYLRPEKWDIFIGLLWIYYKRSWGAEGEAMKGNEAEFKMAHDAWRASRGRRPRMLFYGNRHPAPPPVIEGVERPFVEPRLAKTDAFFRQLIEDGEYPIQIRLFEDADDLREVVERDLIGAIEMIERTRADGWEAEAGKLPPGVKLLRSLEGHRGAVKNLAFDPSGRALVSGSADETVKVWDVNSGRLLETFTDTPAAPKRKPKRK